ncbi:MAG TPA: hypothetical protein PK289_08940, partial [Bacteroidia bacterium]|nr:hypothetical protein [Bacteroidia bacterium]
FYWCSSQNNKTVFIVVDCTGHGVPGAFMSMIGNTLLNEIVNELKITSQKNCRTFGCKNNSGPSSAQQ